MTVDPFYVALGGSVVAVLVGGTGFARAWVRPAAKEPGRHRAPRAVRPLPLGALADEAMESVEWAWCATEQRSMEHGAMPCGALACLGCGRVTEVV